MVRSRGRRRLDYSTVAGRRPPRREMSWWTRNLAAFGVVEGLSAPGDVQLDTRPTGLFSATPDNGRAARE